MLPPVVYQQPGVIKPGATVISDPNINKLLAALTNIERQPNILTVDEFRPFEPLFRKDALAFRRGDGEVDTNLVAELSERYLKTVRNLYQITVIIKSRINPVVLVKLPPLLTPFRMIPNNEATDQLVSANQKLFHHHVPKYGAEAFRNMVAVMMVEQRNNLGVAAAYQRAFQLCDADFQQRYGITAATAATPAPVAESMTELVMEDDDG